MARSHNLILSVAVLACLILLADLTEGRACCKPPSGIVDWKDLKRHIAAINLVPGAEANEALERNKRQVFGKEVNIKSLSETYGE